MDNSRTTLTGLFTNIADAIREKTGSTESIVADEFPEAIAAIDTQENLDPELSTQDDLIAQIAAALEGKTGASGVDIATSSVTIAFEHFSDAIPITVTTTKFENNNIVTSSNLFTTFPQVISNVVYNSILTIKADSFMSVWGPEGAASIVHSVDGMYGETLYVLQIDESEVLIEISTPMT